MSHTERIATLKHVLEGNPNDPFARYALGLEYSGTGNNEAALAEFQQLLKAHPDYTNGYFMAAQTLVRIERANDARVMLRNGIESARRTRNQHAMAEMQGLLEEIGES